MRVITAIFVAAALLVAASAAGGKEFCHQMLAPSGATADGSVIMSYGNDFTGANPLGVDKVASMPAADYVASLLPNRCRQIAPMMTPEGRDDGTTWPHKRVRVYLGSRYITEGGLNEAGLGVTFGAYNYGKAALWKSGNPRGDPWINDGMSFELWDLFLALCKTPACAVDVMETVAAECGLSEDVVGSMPIGTSDGIWLIEVVSGHHWIAARVPSDRVLLQSNSFRLRELPLSDPATYRASEGITEFAERLGLYDPSSGPLDPAAAFGTTSRSVNMRLSRLFDLLAHGYFATHNLQYESSFLEFPTFVAPDAPITVDALVHANRDHFEGTPLAKPYTVISPHYDPDYAGECRYFTGYMATIVFPAPATGRPPHMLISLGAHCLGSLVPFFEPGASVPQTWRPYEGAPGATYAFTLAKLIQNNVDSRRGGNDRTNYGLFYPTINSMRNVYEGAMETQLENALEQMSTMPDGSAQKTALMDSTTDSLATGYFSLLTGELAYVNQKP